MDDNAMDLYSHHMDDNAMELLLEVLLKVHSCKKN